MTPRVFAIKVLRRIRHLGWRILKTLSKPDRMYSFRLPDGSRFDYPLRSSVGEHLFAGWFEAAEIAFVRRHLKPGDVVLDVGANAGLYTLLAARIVGERGHVYAFEPGPREVAMLRHNIAVNKLNNVTVIEAAVSNQTGEASFAIARDGALSSLASIDRPDQQIEAWTTVSTIRLDDAVRTYQIPRVDFIKVDVEGAEKLVFEGATHLIASTHPPFAMVFEAYEPNSQGFGYTVPELLTAVQHQGFALHYFNRSGQLRPVKALQPEFGASIYNFVAFKH